MIVSFGRVHVLSEKVGQWIEAHGDKQIEGFWRLEG